MGKQAKLWLLEYLRTVLQTQEDTVQRKAVVLVLQVWGHICSYGGQQESFCRNFFNPSEHSAWGKVQQCQKHLEYLFPTFR